MNTAYNVDEQVEQGIYDVLMKYLDDAIDENNATSDDGYVMKHFDPKCVYREFVPLPGIVEGKIRPFPSLCFYIDGTTSEIANRNKDKDRVAVRLAVFTSGTNSAILYKRYLATIREVLESHDEEIAPCVFRGYCNERRYYPPTSYNSNEMVYIAEMYITITVEVRK